MDPPLRPSTIARGQPLAAYTCAAESAQRDPDSRQILAPQPTAASGGYRRPHAPSATPQAREDRDGTSDKHAKTSWRTALPLNGRPAGSSSRTVSSQSGGARATVKIRPHTERGLPAPNWSLHGRTTGGGRTRRDQDGHGDLMPRTRGPTFDSCRRNYPFRSFEHRSSSLGPELVPDHLHARFEGVAGNPLGVFAPPCARSVRPSTAAATDIGATSLSHWPS